MDPKSIISPQRRELQVVGDLAANIEVEQGPFDCGIFQIYDNFCLLDDARVTAQYKLKWGLEILAVCVDFAIDLLSLAEIF